MRRILLAGLMAALLLATLSISTASAQLPGLEPVVSDLSETEPDGPSIWQAAYPARASQVAAMLPGLDVLWRWDGQRWQPYATTRRSAAAGRGQLHRRDRRSPLDRPLGRSGAGDRRCGDRRRGIARG